MAHKQLAHDNLDHQLNFTINITTTIELWKIGFRFIIGSTSVYIKLFLTKITISIYISLGCI